MRCCGGGHGLAEKRERKNARLRVKTYVDELRIWLLAVGHLLGGGGAVGTFFLGVRHDDCDVVENSDGRGKTVSGLWMAAGLETEAAYLWDGYYRTLSRRRS